MDELQYLWLSIVALAALVIYLCWKVSRIEDRVEELERAVQQAAQPAPQREERQPKRNRTMWSERD